MRNLGIFSIVVSSLVLSACFNDVQIAKELKDKELKAKQELGQVLYFDKNLSKNRTQACSTCHNPGYGFVDPRDNGVQKMASLGDDAKSIGDRQAPSAAYAMYSPKFHFDKKKQKYIGGQFWDGRADTLAAQAGGPPLNPAEMGMPSKDAVIKRLLENPYYIKTFKEVYGKDIFNSIPKAYTAMTDAIESFEKTKEFAPFDSKYDRYLRGEYDLTPLEDLGKSIFFSNNNNSCASCHVLKGEDREGETFTNYEFHNIGVPQNKKLRAKNGVKGKDTGLVNNPLVKDKSKLGKYKVPTLRNVAITAPYMHNGVFKDLRTVVEFYDKYNDPKRKINPETKKPWAEPEYGYTISFKELKAKRQNDRKIDALVAFLKLLTDKRYENLLEKGK